MEVHVVLCMVRFFRRYFAQKLVFLRGSPVEVYKYSCWRAEKVKSIVWGDWLSISAIRYLIPLPSRSLPSPRLLST